MSNRIAGKIELQKNGVILDAIGNFDYNLGEDLKTGMVGADRTHGYSAKPQICYIEGEIRDAAELDLKSLVKEDNTTLTLSLANGKVIALYQAWYASEGKGGSEEANIEGRWEGMSCEEIK